MVIITLNACGKHYGMLAIRNWERFKKKLWVKYPDVINKYVEKK